MNVSMRVPLTKVLLGWVLSLGLVGLAPDRAFAEEQLTEITWGHPTPKRVTGFVVLISPTASTSENTRWVEVGKPGGKSSSTMSFYTALVPVASDEFISIGAIGTNGLMSSMSPWAPIPPSPPGQPLVIQP